jgi:hypothetical protein
MKVITVDRERSAARLIQADLEHTEITSSSALTLTRISLSSLNSKLRIECSW